MVSSGIKRLLHELLSQFILMNIVCLALALDSHIACNSDIEPGLQFSHVYMVVHAQMNLQVRSTSARTCALYTEP